MQQSKGQRCQSQEEATLVPTNHSNDLLFSPTAKHSRIQSNFNQMHIKPDVLWYAWIYYCGCLIISCAIHVTNEYNIAHKQKRDIIFTKEVSYENYVHWNFSVLLNRLFIVVPTVEKWRFEDCEEEVTVYFKTKLTKTSVRTVSSRPGFSPHSSYTFPQYRSMLFQKI
jgi:hypothetical protein